MSASPRNRPAPVSTVRKSDWVAQELLDRIAASGAAPGQTLATETQLLARFDVSRPTLPEWPTPTVRATPPPPSSA